MNELFLKIINMSITASWLVLAVIAVRLVFQKTPKWILCLFWGLVAVRLICPFSIESRLSLIPDTEQLLQDVAYSAETVKQARGDILGAEGYVILERHQPADRGDILDSEGNVVLERHQPADRGEILDSDGNVIVEKNVGAVSDPRAAQAQSWIHYLARIWLIGISVMLVYTLVSYFLLKRKVATAIPIGSGIKQSEFVDSSFVLGIIRPVIYLPFGMMERDMTYVVAHEQAHIRRKDHWWKPLGFLLLMIHWFNPLMWLAYVLLCRDIELACDEKVIEDLSNEQRADYTQSLVACSVNRRMIAACPLAFGEVGVKERVKSVMNYRKPAFWIILVSIVACIVAAVCFLTNPKHDSFTLRIVVPAGSQKAVVYADEEISPLGNYIIVTSGDGLGDTEVSLKTVQVKTETAYDEPVYLTHGMPVRMTAEEGGWFRIGVNIQNDTDEDRIVYLNVENVEVRISSPSNAAMKWFDYTEDSSDMPWNSELKIQLDEFPDITFKYTPYEIIATTSNGNTILITGMPIWNAYFTDLTGDGLPEICSEVSFGSGIIDNHVIIFDYANGVSYKLEDRGYHDYFLRMNDTDGCLYVDKKLYKSDEFVSSGKLVFKDGCIQLEGMNAEPTIILKAKLLEINNGYFLVEPVDRSWELNSADKIEIPMKNMNPTPEPLVGDILQIEYDGQIQETYPARISNPYSIRVVEKAETWDLIPMVMVNGTLYLDTGLESTVNARCGMWDGEITSQVAGSEKPSADDQSNFGTGYGYQYGATEGTIELYMNGKWWIFATEEVRQEMQSSSASNEPNKFYLTIGAEGVKSIELSMPNSSGGCEHADGSLYKKGERIWLENLDGYNDLRGITITALDKNGEIVWSASIPDGEENKGFTHLTQDDWAITDIE